MFDPLKYRPGDVRHKRCAEYCAAIRRRCRCDICQSIDRVLNPDQAPPAEPSRPRHRCGDDFSPDEIQEIRERYSRGESVPETARAFGTRPHIIHRLAAVNRWVRLEPGSARMTQIELDVLRLLREFTPRAAIAQSLRIDPTDVYLLERRFIASGELINR